MCFFLTERFLTIQSINHDSERMGGGGGGGGFEVQHSEVCTKEDTCHFPSSEKQPLELPWLQLCINNLSTYRQERSVVLKVHSHRVHLECLDITIRSICYGIIRHTGGLQFAVRLHRGCCQGNSGALPFHGVRCVVIVVARKEDVLFL